MILLAIIIVSLLGWGLWKIGMSVVEKQNREVEAVRRQQEIKKAKEEEDNKKAQKLLQQKDLIEKYVTSGTTLEMLHMICKGDPLRNLPREIVICNNSITGYHTDGVCTFDFAANRVHSFSPIITVVRNREELQYVLRPQMAMAEAINHLLSNQYAIYDNANWKYDHYTDSDGELHFSHTYSSNSVKMVLKSTLPNRSF